MTLKSDAKFEKKLTCCLENDEEFCKFLPEHSKVSKLELWWDPFVQSWKCMGLKFTVVLGVMTGIDFSFQNWPEKFKKFWLEHSKI